jgi:hypothetical protein
VFGHYEKAIDRESAYEILKGQAAAPDGQPAETKPKTTEEKQAEFKRKRGEATAAKPPAKSPSPVLKVLTAVVMTLARSLATTLGRSVRWLIESALKGGKGKGRRGRD